MIDTSQLGPMSHASDLPTITCKEALRREIERQQEEFLARGGKINTASIRSLTIQIWNGTDNQAKHLIPMGTISKILNMSPLEVELVVLQPGFPVAYMYKGETHWSGPAVKKWSHANRRYADSVRGR